MASRIPSALRSAALARPTIAHNSAAALRRSFQTSQRMQETVIAAAPVRKPVGAFRGTIFGFLLGSTLSGAGLYYYVVDEYRVSNELLSEDVYALQSAVQRLEGYVKGLEQDVKSRK